MVPRLKILLIMRDFSKWGNPKQYFLGKELAKMSDLIIWHHAGDIRDIVKKIPFQPDFILLMHYTSKPHMYPPITGLSALDIPFGVFIRDLQGLSDLPENIKRDNVQHIFSCFKDGFKERFPELMHKMIWLPNHVYTPIFKDYHLDKRIDMLMMGNTYRPYYPLRYKIREQLQGRSNFTYHSPPRHRFITNIKNALVREDYAREINRAKIFFTCGSIFHYPVMKYFEVLACNTLLLAPNFNELADLGFQDGKNYVSINENDFLEKAEYYLKNEDARKRIAKNGYRFVHQKHSTTKRAAELIQQLQRIING